MKKSQLRGDSSTLRFWHRSDKVPEGSPAPLHLVYQLHSNKRCFSIPESNAFPANWDKEHQRFIYIDKKTAESIAPKIKFSQLFAKSEVEEKNAKIQEIIKEVEKIESRFRLYVFAFDCDKVISELKEIYRPLSKRIIQGKNIVDFIKQFVLDSSGSHKPGTLKVYSGLAAHIKGFEEWKKRKMTFEEADLSTLKAFRNYLSEKKSMEDVTAAKQLSTLKTLLNYARTEYKIPVNMDYRDFKVSRKSSDFEIIAMNYEEFLSLYNLDLSENKTLDQVRDIFCFSCATGLRYSDLNQLRREHIGKDNVIRMTSEKTGQKLAIDLNVFSHSILKKYADKRMPLPVTARQEIMRDQPLNRCIKRLGKMAGIDSPVERVRKSGIKKVRTLNKKYERLSIHVGRKSFISISSEKGMALQDIMSFSGHKTYSVVRAYLNIDEKRKKVVMGSGWGEVPALKAVK